MEENHKMTKNDKLALGTTLAIIFFGILGLGLLGVMINIFS